MNSKSQFLFQVVDDTVEMIQEDDEKYIKAFHVLDEKCIAPLFTCGWLPWKDSEAVVEVPTHKLISLDEAVKWIYMERFDSGEMKEYITKIKSIILTFYAINYHGGVINNTIIYLLVVLVVRLESRIRKGLI